MLQTAVYRALNALPLMSVRPAARKFDQALSDPAKAQRTILFELLRRNETSAYGQQHSFASIRSVREYQQRVPIAGYDDLAPWVERIKGGEGHVLTSEPVLMFEKSSGSASAAKYIPYTRTLSAQFRAALAPWIHDMCRAFPGLDRGCAYWVVTPLSRGHEITPGGIPVGFESDTEYFGSVCRWMLRKTMAVPAEVAQVLDLETCFYLTLRFLLQARSLTFISVWNPSFLLILLDRLEQYGDRLVRDLRLGGASALEPISSAIPVRFARHVQQAERLNSMLHRGRIEPKVLWPELRLISCWTSAASSAIASDIRQRFPGVAIQGKGLLATEGVVSIPVETYGGCVAAITSHFLEFLDQASGDQRLVAELHEGREYSVLLTTGGGLWRYKLGDRVRVTGFAKRSPILEFLEKEDYVSDLRGEKLNATFVASIFTEFESCRSARFAMLAPSEAVIPRYVLLLESAVCEPDLASRLDDRLQANPHYAYCRRIGQLGGLRVFRVRSGASETYLQHCKAGQRAGAVKLTSLDKRSGWECVFTGSYLDVGSTKEICA
jgi:hypothetical protein